MENALSRAGRGAQTTRVLVKKAIFAAIYFVAALILEIAAFLSAGLGVLPGYFLLDLSVLLMVTLGVFIVPGFVAQIVVIGVLLFYNQFVNQDLGLRQSVISMVAALIGMIPEGLFLLTSVALAVSVVRLARNRTLIHEMNAIETLARVDVLCVDKTGTVTSPQMQVREVVPLDPASCSDADIADILGAFYRVLEPDNDTARALAEKFTYGPGWPSRGAILTGSGFTPRPSPPCWPGGTLPPI